MAALTASQKKTREIAAGEQVTISYADLALPAWQRRQRLHDRYRFNCSCHVCRALCGQEAADSCGQSDDEENNKNGRGEAREGPHKASMMERALDETKWGLACPRAAEGCAGWLLPWPRARWMLLYERLLLRSLESEVSLCMLRQ